MKQLNKDLSKLVTMVNTNNIPCTDVNIKTLDFKVNTLQNLITSIEETGKDQDLPSNLQTNPHSLETPSFSDNPSKVFTTYGSNSKEEARANKEYTTATETKQSIQQEAQDAPRGQQPTSGPTRSLEQESEQDKNAKRPKGGGETDNNMETQDPNRS